MVIGILSTASKAETCLNNLSEADFDLSHVSVVMKDRARNPSPKNTGPLKGATNANLAKRLVQFGISKTDAQSCTKAVAEGQALIAIDCPRESQSAALEILQDYDPDLAKIVPPIKS